MKDACRIAFALLCLLMAIPMGAAVYVGVKALVTLLWAVLP